LRDLSDVTLIFCLPGARKPGPAPTNLRDMEQRGFVYRAVVDTRRHGVSVSTTRQSFRLSRAYMYSAVCILSRNKQRIKQRRMGRRESRARKSAALMAMSSSCGKDTVAFFRQTERSLCPARTRFTSRSTSKIVYQVSLYN